LEKKGESKRGKRGMEVLERGDVIDEEQVIVQSADRREEDEDVRIGGVRVLVHVVERGESGEYE
jgi:hypothetical protein